MTMLKQAALVAAVIGAAGIGAALAPVVAGQSPAPRVRVTPRVEMLGVRGGQIGVSIRDVAAADVKGTNAGQGGVVIEDVTEGGPADKAGVRKGDIVVDFDGERVRSARQFTRLVQETPAGRQVQAAVMRDGQKVTLSIEPREREGFSLMGDFPDVRVFGQIERDFPPPPVPPAAPVPPTPPAFPDIDGLLWRTGGALGLTVSDLSTQLAEYFGVKDGVLVTSVAADSAGARAGVKAGDVVTSLNGATIESPSELRRQVQRLENGSDFTLGVMRDRKSLSLKGKVEQPRNRWTYRS
jgi:serine protease Do